MQEDSNAEHLLVAYLVLADQQEPLRQEALRTYLGRHLPDYMHPSRFMVIDTMPLTPNGKIDLQALIHLSGKRMSSDVQFVPAGTRVEQILATLWSEALEVADVGIHDNFFRLGGDSILAIQLIAKARQQRLFLTLRQLFQYQTIAQLAVVCEQTEHQPANERVVEQETETAYPLSPGQRGLLFHTLSAPEGAMYFEQVCCKFQGKLNVTALHQAWQQVIQDYAVLRSAFVWENLREPVQMTQAQVQLPWISLDWQDLDGSEVQPQLTRYLAADRQRGFDLTRAPLMRVALLRLDRDTTYFVWSYHHLLLDGWSVSLLLKSVLQAYQAFNEGQALHLQPVRSYRDYITWLSRQDNTAAETFWRQELAGFTSPTTLSYERQQAALLIRDPHYEEEEHALPASLTARARAMAEQHQLTLNTVLQGAWAALLSCCSGEKDILYGTVSSGRSAALEGIEEMLGIFISTLPVRVQLPPQMAVIEWLKRLQEHQALLQQYDYCALSDIQKWSMMSSSLPLFTSIFIFENYPVDRSLLTWDAGVQVEDVTVVEHTNYPLSIVASPGDVLWLRATYDSQSFEPSDIRGLLQRLQVILEQIVEKPEHRLADLICLTEDERRQMLFEWNRTAQAYPDKLCLHQLFEAQVALTPEALAVSCEDERLNYRELNRRANQLASYLQKRGVGPGVHVGLYLERSVDMLVSVLAVLKAGGVYIPLDSDYPQERLALMWQDASITTVLTQRWLIESLQEQTSIAPVIVIDAEQTSLAEESPENIPCQVTSQHIAYILYTSGSTGRPKGVMISHQALVNYLSWCCEAYNVAQGQGSPLYTTLSFDLTCTSLFAPLLVGRPLLLLPQTRERDVEMLSQVLQVGANLSLVKMTPTHLELLNYLLPARELAGRANVLVLGGEALQGHQVRPWQASAPRTRLINEYGPTEATVGCCVYELSPEETITASVPIGRPIANVQLYVLDANLQPVPVGVPAELYIGGSCLAYGYLNMPDLTAERFIPHPFSSLPGARLYKTGDLAR